MPKNSAEKKSLESLLCGAPVREVKLKEQLRQNALLHLFVVSGAHLLWLDQWLLRVKCPVIFRFILWTLFSLACGWQPPVVRALTGLSLRHFSGRWRCGLRADQEVLLAGLATLSLYPAWSSSLSLALSWGAALALSLPTGEGWRRLLRQGLLIWVMLLPLLASWSVSHPLGLLTNLFLAPIFSFVFLPLGTLSVLIPWLTPVFDFSFGLFRDLLGLMPAFLPPTSGTPPRAEFFWCWLGFLHFLIHGILLHQKRRRG